MMIYVAAWDCPPCHGWANNVWPTFKDSPEFQKIAWRKIDAKTIRSAYSDSVWPEELRRFRDEAKLKGGVPRWVIVKDGKVFFDGRGTTAGTVSKDFADWSTEVVPALKNALAGT